MTEPTSTIAEESAARDRLVATLRKALPRLLKDRPVRLAYLYGT